jgi:hypothetical protein
MGSHRTRSGRSPVAGIHKLPDHWEYRNILVLHGTKADEPVLRVCIRAEPQGKVGDSTWVDFKARDAAKFAKTVFVIAGYEVPDRKPRDQPIHCSIYQARSFQKGRSRVRTFLCIYNHDAPVRVRASHDLSKSKLVELAQWLAPRLGWELSEAA